MTQLELDAQAANQLYEQCKRKLIEDRLLVAQWCACLVQHYNSATDDVRSKLPPLPGTKAEEMLPSLYVEDLSDLNVEQYQREAAALTHIQREMNRLHLAINQEAVKCLSTSTPQN